MPRSKGFVEGDLLAAAQEIFWAHGYQATGVTVLEEGTGLSRSSIYHVFGSKKSLFTAVLDLYRAEFVDPLLTDMEHGKPGLGPIVGFFRDLARYLDGDLQAGRRGCLLVNTIFEFPDERDAPPAAAGLPARLRAAFTRCLRAAARGRSIGPSTVDRRAAMLEAATLGIWLAARQDPALAVQRCNHIASEVASWRTRKRATRT